MYTIDLKLSKFYNNFEQLALSQLRQKPSHRQALFLAIGSGLKNGSVLAKQPAYG
jgi:hypothetical protein